MKKLTTLLLAGAGALLITQSAHATNTSFSTGDLIIGFYDNNASSDYEIDLGKDSQFLTAGGISTFNGLSLNLGSDLGSTFSSTSPTSSWTTDVNLNWGAAAYSDTSGSNGVAAKTLFLTLATGSSAPSDQSSSANGTIGGAIKNIASAFANKATTASTTNALIQSNGATGAWVTSQAGASQATGPNSGGSSFVSGLNINNTFANGTADAGLDLYEMAPGTSTTPKLLGTFEISNSGVLSFSPEAVPEPSTYALMALGIGMLFWVVRRRSSFRA